MTTYLEVHVIQNLPPSNVNRDDTGAPKAAIYGGVNRLRVSSQAWKRAARESFGADIDEAQRSTRTKRIVRLLAGRIQARREMDEDRAGQLAVDALNAAGVKVTPLKGKQEAKPSIADAEADALFFISNQQLENLAELAVASGDDAIDKKAAKAAIDKDHGVEIALFGRMVASTPALNVDAAVQVAHAISTHAIDPQGDFYTAVDDAKGRDEDSGAGMMGTIEFASATLYRYAAVGLELLAENLGDVPLTGEAAAAFVKGFALSLPSGKKNSFAADTLPSAIVITPRDTRPLSLVGAFERPVRATNDGFVAASVDRMAQHAAQVQESFGLEPVRQWVVGSADLQEALAGFGDLRPLPVVLDEVREAVTACVQQEKQ